MMSSKIVELLKKKAIEQVMKSAVAMSVVVDKYYSIKYNKDFLTLLLEDPLEAYRSLIEYFDSVESADFYLYLVLRPIFSHEVDRALESLKQGDDKAFKELLEKVLKYHLERT